MSSSEKTQKAGSISGHPRYVLLDALRGATFFSMMLYHAMWDLVYLFGMPLAWYRGTPGFVWQQSICWTFLLLSGFCWPLGGHPLRRGLQTSACGLLVTAVTLLWMPQDRVIFGVLTLLGACMLLMIPLNRLLCRVPPEAGFLMSAGLFLLFYHINAGYLSIGGWKILQLPQRLYCGLPATFLGFQDPSFFSTDYFSLFPWMFLFVSGYFLCKIWQKNGREPLEKQRFPALEWIGRHSLMLYLLHQPILYAILTAFFSLP